MTTLRINIWTPSLIFGLIASILTLGCSKARVEYLKHAEYVYVNKTNYQISFPKPNSNVIVKANSSTVFNISDDGSEVVDESSYQHTPFDTSNEYKIIKFGDNKCLDLSTYTLNNPSNIKNYSSERIDTRKYRFTLTFEEADYNRAVDCP